MVAIPRRTIHLYQGELADLIRVATESPERQRAVLSAFEDAFTRHLGVRYAIPVGAGRLGLRLILEGLGIGSGDGVLLPAFTDQSVPDAIRRIGAEPIFVDVGRRTHNLDPTRLEDAMGPRVRAVIATHLFGAPCDMDCVLAFAERHGLAVIEDCAHAIAAKSRGRRCGTLGRAAIFSFVVTKAVNTFGGGMVATDDPELARSIRSAVDALPLPEMAQLARRVLTGYALGTATRPQLFGLLGAPLLRGLRGLGRDVLGVYDRLVRPQTINANVDCAFSPIQAIAGLQQLRRLEQTQAARSRIAESLGSVLPASLTPQDLLEGDEHAWYFFIATAADPDAVVAELLRRGVDVGRYPMRNCPALIDPVAGAARFPNAEYVYRHALQLPTYPTLDEAGVAHLTSAVASL